MERSRKQVAKQVAFSAMSIKHQREEVGKETQVQTHSRVARKETTHKGS